MNDLRVSNALRALIEAAKSDGPNTATRAEVWSSVCHAVAPPAAPASTRTLGSAGGGKTVSIGALFGGAVTVGLATAVLILQPMRSIGQSSGAKQVTPTASARVVFALPSGDVRPMRTEAPLDLRPAVSASPPSPAGVEPSLESVHGSGGVSVRAPASSAGALPPSRPSSRPSSAGSPGSQADAFDPLAREASLLTRARAALGQGDPRAALHAVRAAMAVPGRQLVPEELSVESQALRALGRPRDADALTTELRARYPDSALAR